MFSQRRRTACSVRSALLLLNQKLSKPGVGCFNKTHLRFWTCIDLYVFSCYHSCMKTDSLKLDKTLVKPIIQWYRANARDLPWRRDREPYHVWLSEIMLQQTRVEAAVNYYNRFLKALPNIQSLAEADEQKLLKLWEGLGYYNRVRHMQKAANMIVNEYAGIFPRGYAQIIKLPGIGPYTAGAVSSICFDVPIPAVDGNVLRVMTRVAQLSTPVDSSALKKDITNALAALYPKRDCGTFTQALMELGALICIPNGMPKCGICPIHNICSSNLNGVTDQIPVRAKKMARRVEHRTVFVLICNGQYAINRRKPKGLLANLWEFPNMLETLDAQAAVDVAASWQVQPYNIKKTICRTHVFTHIEWHMTCHFISCRAQSPQFTWASLDALNNTYALPTAFRIFSQP